ncbi:MAG TPA: DUF6379 domain-containing protein [Anaerolineales bacterium]|nr:DUF6379 domain-containing protein [Anaerolineales bacterium]
MYDKAIIVGEEFKNVNEAGTVKGFQVGMRIPYYRGVVLSLLDNTRLVVDGELIPHEQISVTISGKNLPLTALEDDPVTKWEFGDVGILTVDRPGGLSVGEHTVQLYQHVRTPYIPRGVGGQDEKVLTISA